MTAQQFDYNGSDGWREDAAQAADKFLITNDEQNGPVRYVAATAGTGDRFAVVVTLMPEEFAQYEGGSALVSLLAPYRGCYPMSQGGYLDWTYVREKFLPLHVNAGTLVGVTLTIAHALRSEAGLPARRKEVADGDCQE